MESPPTIEYDETIEQAVQLLPPEIQVPVREFIESLLAEQIKPVEASKPKLDWRGALRDLREQYTSVELAHQAHKSSIPLDTILERLDAILLEVQELRQDFLSRQQPVSRNLVAELYGSWGQETEQDYVPGIEWQRFSDE